MLTKDNDMQEHCDAPSKITSNDLLQHSLVLFQSVSFLVIVFTRSFKSATNKEDIFNMIVVSVHLCQIFTIMKVI